jgi:hypothetical protein
MLKYLICCFLVFHCGLLYAQVETLGVDVDAQESINLLMDRVESVSKEATASADYISENRLKEVKLVLNQFQFFIQNERISVLGDLKAERMAIFREVEQIVNNSIANPQELNKLSSIMTANIQTIVNNIGGLGLSTEDQFEIYQINGLAQSFKEEGFYSLDLIGNVFGQEFEAVFTLDGQRYPIERMPNANTQRRILIPSQVLNPSFADDTLRRVHFRLTIDKFKTKKKKMRVLDLQDSLLLLPRFPVRYEFILHTNNYVYGKPYLCERLTKIFKIPGTYMFEKTVDEETIIDSLETRWFQPDSVNIRQYLATSLQSVFRWAPNPAGLERQLRAGIGNWAGPPEFLNDNHLVRRQYVVTGRPSGNLEIWVDVFCRDRQPSTEPKNHPLSFIGGENGLLRYDYEYHSEFTTLNTNLWTLRIKDFFGEWKTYTNGSRDMDNIILTPSIGNGLVRYSIKVKR